MEGAPAPVPLEALLAHREWVRRVAHALVADENLAEDLEQDLWVEAIERPPRARGSLRGWIATVLRNKLLNRRRGEARRAFRENVVAHPEAVPAADALVADAEALRRVVNAVMDLAEPYRSTLLLRFYEGQMPGEIARRQGIPVETVRTRIKRALGMLRERFDAEHRGNREAWCLALLPLVSQTQTAAGAGTGAAAAAKTGIALGGILVAAKALGAVAAVLALAAGGWHFLHAGSPVSVSPPSTLASMPERVPPGMAPVAVPVASGDASPSSASGSTGVVEGVVTDGAGRPVSGAEVVILGCRTDAKQKSVSVGIEAGRTRSGPDGRYRVDLEAQVPPSIQAIARETGREGVASARPFRVSHFAVGTLQAGETTTIDLVLEEGLIVRGRVLDATGRPAAAKVVPGNRHIGGDFAAEARTDAEGRFEISGIPPVVERMQFPVVDAPLFLVARGEEGRGESGPLDARPGTPLDGILIRLVPVEARTASISGRVCDPDGAPIEGARVLLDVNDGNQRVEEDAEANRESAHGEPVAVADDGSFRIEKVDTTHHDRVALVGQAPGWFPRRVEVRVAGGSATDGVRVELRAGSQLRGRLLREDGTPAAGVPVQAQPCPEGGFGSSGAPPGAVTDADGSFAIRPVSSRHLCVNFGPDPFAPLARVNGVWADDGPIEVRLPSTGTLRGRALASDGGPAANVGVQWTSTDGRNPAPRKGTTAADGSFLFQDVPDGAFVLCFGAPWGADGGFLPMRTAPYAAATRSVEVTLERGLAIEGVVSGADGKPAAACSLMAVSTDPMSGIAPVWGSTSADGSFRLAPLPAGAYIVAATLSDPTVRSGEAIDDRESVPAGTKGLKLRLSDEGFIRGRVVDATGEAPSAQVTLTLTANRRSMTTFIAPGEGGRFALPAIKGRIYTLDVQTAGGGLARVDSVVGGARNIEVRLGTTRGGALKGVVRDGEGNPAAGLRVRARLIPAGAGMLEQVSVRSRESDSMDEIHASLLGQKDLRDARTGSDGTFDFGAMPAGRWVVWAGEPGSTWRPANHLVFEGAGGPVDLRVAGGWTLRGRLLDGAGKPRLFVMLQVRPQNTLTDPVVTFQLTVTTGRGGTFEVPGLPPGPVTILEANVPSPPAWTIEEQGVDSEPETLTPPR